MKRAMTIVFSALIIMFSSGISAGETYKLSMLPRYSADEINKRISPLTEYLSQKIGTSVKPVIASNFSQYEKRLKNGEIQIAYENSYIYVRVSKIHEVLAMAIKGKGGDRFRGIIIVRKNSNIVSLEDLKGKKISIVGITSAGGYLSQKLALRQKGIDVEKDCHISEAVDNKQENVILSVFLGEADAGFIRESALHMADKFVPPSKIKVINKSAWLPNWALSVKRSIPAEKKKAIQRALVSLKKNHPVLKALKIDRFRIATDREYDTVRQAAGMKMPDRKKK